MHSILIKVDRYRYKMDDVFLYLELLNNITMGIFAVNLDMEIVFFNSEAEKITGFTKDEAMGQRCYEIFRTELCYKNCYLKKAIKEKKKFTHVRNTILNKNNKEIPVDITVSSLYDIKGKIRGGFESFIDNSLYVQLEKELYKNYSFEDIIAKDEKMVNLMHTLLRISQTDIPVIITGETGVGKDVFASAIHNRSNRHDKPFIKVNCAALPVSLIESELFGYKKGAFTDAKTDKLGRFQEANGGTILLDEIGDLPIELQAKLLQVLDEKEFYPLGSKKPIKVDVRIISTTNKNLKDLIKNRLFREDLYYRLNGIEFEIPPLRERRSDIPLLIEHFLDIFSKTYNKTVQRVDSNVLKALLNHDFPGNVHELKHIIEFGVAVSDNNEITYESLPIDFRKKTESKNNIKDSYIKASNSYEKEQILNILESNDWDIGKTAQILNIHRTTLWRKMKKYGLFNTHVA